MGKRIYPYNGIRSSYIGKFCIPHLHLMLPLTESRYWYEETRMTRTSAGRRNVLTFLVVSTPMYDRIVVAETALHNSVATSHE